MTLPEILKTSWAYLDRGGFVMIPILGVMVILWYALGSRWITLRRGNRRSVRGLIEKYRKGYERAPRGVIDAAVTRGLEVAVRCPPHLRHHLDEAFGEFDDRLNRYDRLVKTLVTAAPLLGLLGTVTGMIETFTSLGEGAFYSHSGGIAGGISEALYTTQFGLSVAIPGMILGRILRKRQNDMAVELSKIKDLICAQARMAA